MPSPPAATRATRTPVMDVYESERDFLLITDLPGISTEDLDLQIEKDRLSINATRKSDGTGPPLVYQRAFALAPIFDTEKGVARLERGVLTIRLPKNPDSRPRSVPVVAG
ncbi:MAG: Hsp20/alpha crystallin family protein [Myxococcales bacterium]|nr:Hsp20/alpha crystallin family protein [Myxococcales bacterium]